jgi:hypothetical protein
VVGQGGGQSPGCERRGPPAGHSPCLDNCILSPSRRERTVARSAAVQRTPVHPALNFRHRRRIVSGRRARANPGQHRGGQDGFVSHLAFGEEHHRHDEVAAQA